ncbi:methylmalonyl-CoA mutase [Alsobacter metallidurans]|uniref:Methylmalonyl-CoA mutase n=1 Tax=Alsobacter metallidurans TaxID=340221 RepID=A0A917MH04_9HYPH|nr:methylmalonyl-CoA mutase subunit beta [Alsobacter metallidurans]GGH13630.1 methylmalonyl-CoA mutase [Alsobacter metallidurans]
MTQPFVSSFPIPTREQWTSLVDAVLKGKDFERTLVGRTYDGLRIEPLYGKAEGVAPIAGRAPGAGWNVLQRVDNPEVGQAHAQAMRDLEGGATGLQLVFAGAQGAHGFGLPDGSRETVAAALDGVMLDAIHLEIDLSFACKDASEAIAALVEARGLQPSEVSIAFGYDPMGQMLMLGGLPVAWPQLAGMFAGMTRSLADRGFKGPIAAADGRIVHAAGGSEAQELAYAMASALTYWRALEAGGFDLDAARGLIGFRLAADADQFLTIAKFRALRRLWARVEAASGLAPRPIRIHAETAWRMMTRRDPWVNLLRQTVAVFAAGVGGADSISVLPFTQALGLPDAFARRVARNTQLVLLEESNLARVADPAAGAGGLEALTDELCGAAWGLLQELEKAGGLPAALEAGLLQEKVAATRAEREKAAARRKDAITGVSEFPDVREKPVDVLAPAPAVVAAPMFSGVEPLPAWRPAEPFEALRDAADAMRASGGQPSVFLANLGPISAFTARATFSKNLFEAGGIAAVSNDGFARADGATDLDALAAAFRASGAPLACLCASDDIYGREAAEAARALAGAGARRVYLAGRPGEMEAALAAAGVGGFVFAGMDVVAALRDAQAALG